MLIICKQFGIYFITLLNNRPEHQVDAYVQGPLIAVKARFNVNLYSIHNLPAAEYKCKHGAIIILIAIQ